MLMPHPRMKLDRRPQVEAIETRVLATTGLGFPLLHPAIPVQHPAEIPLDRTTAAPPSSRVGESKALWSDRIGAVHAELWFNPFQTLPDPFVPTRRLIQNDLRPGDLLLTTENGKTSKVIRGATNSTYSHIALYVGGGRIIDATSNGVKDRPLMDLTGPAIRVGVIRVSALANSGDHAANGVISEARKLLNKPYNYTGLVTGALFGIAGLATPTGITNFLFSNGYKPTDLGPGYFCSEFIIKAFRSAGITQGFTDAAVTPGDILRTAISSPSLFKLVGRMQPGSR